MNTDQTALRTLLSQAPETLRGQPLIDFVLTQRIEAENTHNAFYTALETLPVTEYERITNMTFFTTPDPAPYEPRNLWWALPSTRKLVRSMALQPLTT